jgi:hypothetical protein
MALQRYDATSFADAARWVREQMLAEVPGRPAIAVLGVDQLEAFEAALLAEITADPQGPIEVTVWTDRRILRAASAVGITTDYRWVDSLLVVLP